MVEAVLENHRAAEISDRLRTTLDFLEKTVLDPRSLSADDVEAMRAAGVEDQAMDDALQVAFVFGIMDRLADAFDFEISDERALKWIARMLLNAGYGGASIPG